MGAGTITMPYIICIAGIGLGTLLTMLGAGLSHYTGNLLVSIYMMKDYLHEVIPVADKMHRTHGQIDL